MGRPSKKKKAVIDEIARRLSEGEPLAQICRTPGMPAASTVREWAQSDDEVSSAIARARILGFDAIAEECLEIANTPLDGEETKYDAEGVVIERKRSDMLGHRKLQIETRLKLLAKWDPKRYGERQTIEHQGHMTLESLVAGDDVE